MAMRLIRFVHNDISVVTLSFNSSSWDRAQNLYLEVLNDLNVADALVSITLKVASVSSNSWGDEGLVLPKLM